MDWHYVDAEFNEYAKELLDSLDDLLFGRVTSQLMAGYWPTSAAIEDDPVIAERMNTLRKIVFSHTLEKAEWRNTRLFKGNLEQEVEKMKQQPGKDIAIFGSSDLSLQLIEKNLIDEYRIFINPIILGQGKTLFKGINNRLRLELTKIRTFGSGLLLLYYQPLHQM